MCSFAAPQVLGAATKCGCEEGFVGLPVELSRAPCSLLPPSGTIAGGQARRGMNWHFDKAFAQILSAFSDLYRLVPFIARL